MPIGASINVQICQCFNIMSYTIESIVEKIGARRLGNKPAAIDWLLTDSRSLCFPEETLFAIPTKRNNGARYIPDLYERGVQFCSHKRRFQRATMDSEQLKVTMAQECNFPYCPQYFKSTSEIGRTTPWFLPDSGSRHYGQQWKDHCKEWLHQLLSPDRVIVRSPRSYNCKSVSRCQSGK